MMSPEASADILLPLTSFVRGLWFDNVVGCYILLLPLLACVVSCLVGYSGKWLLRPVLVWLQVLWSVVFLLSAANIPYFSYFFKNINAGIWNWAEYGPQTLGLLFGEPSYYPPLLAFMAVVSLFVWVTLRLYRRLADNHLDTSRRWVTFLIGIAMLGLCVFGIRGRLGYNPIKVSAAYFCEDAFLNQLGISPTFNLLRTTLDMGRPENRHLQLMASDEAVKLLEEENRQMDFTDRTDSLPLQLTGHPNVVLVFMESMSAHFLQSFGNTKGLTPFLDRLYATSLQFSHCYSTGFHTNQGLFATLYGYPAILNRNMMKGTDIPHYEGLPTVLKQRGYRTMFFMSHEAQYDNMQGFFLTNGFSEIYSQSDYPADKVVNSFGVQDDFLYDYAIHAIGEDTRRPFFASILSISNHPPYVIPSYFTPRSQTIEEQIVEYADWSLEQFFTAASQQPWYDNTLFILVGDHGKLLGTAENEMPQSCNHVAMLMYYPGMAPVAYDGWMTQMDIAPTALALMSIGFSTPFGQNVWERPSRPYAYYCMDDMMGIRSDNRLMIYQPASRQELLYRQAAEGGWSQVHETDSAFAAMRHHLFVRMQAADELTRGQSHP